MRKLAYPSLLLLYCTILVSSCGTQKHESSLARGPANFETFLPCDVVFKKFLRENNTYDELMSLISKDNPSLHLEGADFNTQGKEVERMIYLALEFSDSERKAALSKLTIEGFKGPPDDISALKIHKHATFLLKLALYDSSSWEFYIEVIARSFNLSNDDLKKMFIFNRKMPTELREKLLLLIGERYKDVPKGGGATFGSKRFLDGLSYQLTRPTKFFTKKMREGKSAAEAYASFLDYTGQFMRKSKGFGEYDADLVVEVAKIYQRELNESKDKFSDDFFVSLVGSFPNGKARLATSDIDVYVSNMQDKSFLETMQGKIDASIKQLMQNRGLDHGISTSFLPPVWEVKAFAEVNPIIINIKRDSINIEVYPFNSPFRPEASPKPFIYRLD